MATFDYLYCKESPLFCTEQQRFCFQQILLAHHAGRFDGDFFRCFLCTTSGLPLNGITNYYQNCQFSELQTINNLILTLTLNRTLVIPIRDNSEVVPSLLMSIWTQNLT